MALQYIMPEELGSFSGTGWAGNIASTAADQYTNIAGEGGTYSTNFNVIAPATVPTARGAWICMAVKMTQSTDNHITMFSPSGTTMGSVRMNPTTGQMTIYTGTATLVGTVVFPFVQNNFYYVCIWHDIDATNGEIRVWIDTSPLTETATLEATGINTVVSAQTETGRWRGGVNHGTDYDDMYSMSITIRLDGGSGSLPIVGETLTDATSGATAVVASIVSGDATACVCELQTWDGTAFGNNNTVNGSTAAVYLVDAPNAEFIHGFEPHSWPDKIIHIFAGKPNAVGNSSNLGLLGVGAAAGETLTLAGQPNNNDQVLIDAKTYTFQATLTDVDGNVHIGAAATNTIDNLIAAITLGAGAGTDYATSMTLHPTCTAVVGAGDTMDASANYNGTFGNSISTTDPTDVSGNLSWGATTMSGGTSENYLGVNDLPFSDTDYVQNITGSALKDTYGTDLDSVLPAAQGVRFAEIYARVRTDSSANGNVVVRHSAVDYNGATEALPTSAGWISHVVDTQPDNDELVLDRAVAVAFEIGVSL